jgi:putative transposase
MSVPDSRARLDRVHSALSIRRQCKLLGVARSGVYRAPSPANDNDLALMRQMLGDGRAVNRKRVQRLMHLMGISALGSKPRTSTLFDAAQNRKAKNKGVHCSKQQAPD